MSTQTVTQITTLLGVLVTLVVAITGLIKSIEAKQTAQITAVESSMRHDETVKEIGVVKSQTNGILSAIAPAVQANTKAVDELVAQNSGGTPGTPAPPTPVLVTNPAPLPVVVKPDDQRGVR